MALQREEHSLAKPPILVGSGSGFSGDRVDAPARVMAALIGRGPAALMLETLGERTLALAQLRRRADPTAGYEPRLDALLQPILRPAFEHAIPVLGNIGAANPLHAGKRAAALAREQGLDRMQVAVVTGDDLLTDDGYAVLHEVAADLPLREQLVSANVYLGAAPMIEALEQGAHLVVTGRVADPALALAPAIHHFGWSLSDWDRLGAATMAGHVLECGAQATGGYFADPGFKDVPDPHDVGYPIAAIEADGSFTVGKSPGGGLVDSRTVTEQLLYEVHDPAAYLTPDVTADISQAELTSVGPDLIRVSGVGGKPRPERLKVTVCYDGGWLGEGEISYCGPNALDRARLAHDIVRRRAPKGVKLRADFIGVLSVVGDDDGIALRDLGEQEASDVRLRIAAADADRARVEKALAEIEALYCTGPGGGGGIRLALRPRIATLSCYVMRDAVAPRVTMLEAARA